MHSVPKEEPKIQFIFNNQPNEVPYYTFCSFSEMFRNNFELKEYEIKSEVKETSFKTFLSACKGKYYNVDENNFDDLMKLCTELKCYGIKEDIIEFMNNHEKDKVINYYLSLINAKEEREKEKKEEEEKEEEEKEEDEKEKEIKNVADEIAKNLDLYIDNKALKKLNNDALSNILFNEERSKKVTESQIFEVIKGDDKKIDLYSHLNLGELDEKDFKFLLDSKKWPKSIETKCVIPILSLLYDFFTVQCKNYEELVNRSKKKDEEFANELGPIQSQIREYSSWKHKKENEYAHLENKNREYVTKYDILLKEYNKLTVNYEELFEKQLENEKKLAINCPFRGIIFDLKKSNNDIKNYVEIIIPEEAKDTSKNYNPYNLFDYEGESINNCYYHNINRTKENKDNWIDFKFKNQYEMYGFTIRTGTFGQTFSNPKNFQILGSNDGKQWEIIYEVDDDKNQFLNGPSRYHTYMFDKDSKSYQFFRFLQTDTHFKYKDRFGIIALSAIEFFGKKVELA